MQIDNSNGYITVAWSDVGIAVHCNTEIMPYGINENGGRLTEVY